MLLAIVQFAAGSTYSLWAAQAACGEEYQQQHGRQQQLKRHNMDASNSGMEISNMNMDASNSSRDAGNSSRDASNSRKASNGSNQQRQESATAGNQCLAFGWRFCNWPLPITATRNDGRK